MKSTEFRFSVTEADAYTVISMEGSLLGKDMAQELLNAMGNMVNEARRNHFIIDLSGLSHMNSSGLNVLINILTKARNAGGEVIIANVPERINKLLLITKLNTVFTVTGTIGEAIEKLRDSVNELEG